MKYISWADVFFHPQQKTISGEKKYIPIWVEYVPSTLPSASTQMVCNAGIAHATKWNKCDLFSIASCPHLRPAAKNQANAKHDHHANAAIQQKYNAINRIVHNVDCR